MTPMTFPQHLTFLSHPTRIPAHDNHGSWITMTNEQIYNASTETLTNRLTYLPITSIKSNRFVAYERKIITVELAYRQASRMDVLITDINADSMLDNICYGGLVEDFLIDEPSEFERLAPSLNG